MQSMLSEHLLSVDVTIRLHAQAKNKIGHTNHMVYNTPCPDSQIPGSQSPQLWCLQPFKIFSTWAPPNRTSHVSPTWSRPCFDTIFIYIMPSLSRRPSTIKSPWCLVLPPCMRKVVALDKDRFNFFCLHIFEPDTWKSYFSICLCSHNIQFFWILWQIIKNGRNCIFLKNI
jgi:hypothetical protein